MANHSWLIWFQCAAKSRGNPISYRPSLPYLGVMRRPERTELEFAMLAFLGLAPVGCYTLRFLLGLIG
jgi:hypothetical protein